MADEKNKVEIKITADGDNALVSISRVKDSVKRFRDSVLSAGRAVGRWLSVFSRLNWVMSSLQIVVSWIQSLREWMDRAATSARELAREFERESIATAAAHAAEAYKKLNKELAETNRLEKERSSILAGRKAKERDIEDAKLEFDKEEEISKLDPGSTTYAEDRAAIERKYERKSSKVAAARADEDVKDERNRLFSEAESKDRAADKLKAEYDRQMRIVDRSESLARQYGRDERRGVEGAKEKHDEAEQKWKADFAAAKKTEEAMEALRKEAESLRRRAGELVGGNYAARLRNEALQRRMDNEERAAAAKKETADRAEADRKAMELEKEREISKLDPNSKTYAKDKREIERKYELKEAERKAGSVAGASAPELETARLRIENERREEAAKEAAAEVANENRRRADRIGVLSQMEGAVISADAVSQNRLTAMGLGSGVSAKGSPVANDVRKIVDLLREEIEATKNIKAGEARYGE